MQASALNDSFVYAVYTDCIHRLHASNLCLPLCAQRWPKTPSMSYHFIHCKPPIAIAFWHIVNDRFSSICSDLFNTLERGPCHIVSDRLSSIRSDKLRMLRWVRWHCPLDTRFEIQTLKAWGRARYLSVTETPHNTEFYEWMGKKHFCFLFNRLGCGPWTLVSDRLGQQ